MEKNLSQLQTELSQLGLYRQSILIQETNYNSSMTREALDKARESGLNIYATLQWPVNRDDPNLVAKHFAFDYTLQYSKLVPQKIRPQIIDASLSCNNSCLEVSGEQFGKV